MIIITILKIILQIILILLGIVIIALLAVAIPYLTAEVHYIGDKISLTIGNFIYKKRFDINLKKQESKVSEKPSFKKDTKKENKKKPNVKEKVSDAKNRIFNSEKGFDIDEAIAVKDEFFETASEILSAIKRFFGHLRYKIFIPLIKINLEYGTDDPAATGVLYGSLYGAVGTFYPLLVQYINIDYPQLFVTPDFYNKKLDLEIRSIIKVRPMHIINAAVVALVPWLITRLKYKMKGA